MYMKILVNADDYGFSKSCTDAIFDCFSKGLITTTTACVNGDYFDYGVSLIKNSPYKNKIGIHINLTEGKPLTDKIKKNEKFCNANGTFIGYPGRYKKLSKKDKEDVCCEIQAQIDRFLDSGLSINHLDSHHHVHNSFIVLPLIIKIAKKNNINRIRILRNIGIIPILKRFYKKILNLYLKPFSYSKYMGSAYDFSLRRKKINSTIEIMVHPDYNKNNILIDRVNDDYSNPCGEPITKKYLGGFGED